MCILIDNLDNVMLLFVIILCAGLVVSQPSCKFTGQHGTTLTCTPGRADYMLSRGLVSDNNLTTVVVLKSCRITDVDFESFMNLPSTHTIDLSHNKIQTFKLGVLDESDRVKRFNISYNVITDVPLGLFDMMINLEVLDARGNLFRTIELGVFDNLKKLMHLDLSNNKLESVHMSPYLLDQTKKLTILDYSRNDMSNASEDIIASLEVLDFLNLDRCSLKTVPQFVLKNNLGTLRHLILSTNDIKSITDPNTFQNLAGIEILDLTANKISSLDNNVLKPIKKLITLSLRYNLLEILPDTLFHDLQHLTNLDLSHNHLISIQENSFKSLPRLKRLNLSINRFTFLPENFCKSLRSSGTVLGKFYFNDNPWQCACLKDLLKEVKSLGLGYNGNKYKGKNPVCVEPESWKFSCRRTLAAAGDVHELFDAKDSIAAAKVK